MIGNLSFEEHVRHFTEMYNHLKSVNQHLDEETIINTIYSKVMIVQEWENVAYNLNIEDVYDTAIVKDFEKWLNQFQFHSNNDGNDSNDGNDVGNSQDNEEDERNENIDGDLLGLEYYLRNGGEGGNNEDEDEEDEDEEDEDEDDEDEDDEDEDDEDEDDEEDEDEEDDDEEEEDDEEDLDALVFSYGGFVRRGSPPPEIPDDY